MSITQKKKVEKKQRGGKIGSSDLDGKNQGQLNILQNIDTKQEPREKKGDVMGQRSVSKKRKKVKKGDGALGGGGI